MTKQEQLKLEQLELEVSKLKRSGLLEATQTFYWKEEIIVKWVAIAAMIITALFKL